MPTDTQHSRSNGQQQMDAVVIQASGPPAQSLAYRSEPVPEPGPGEVLVEVHAAAVNPLNVGADRHADLVWPQVSWTI
jgi:NADPH:quinone reductase-like Zn-dependent oxidoreductase